MEADGVEGSIAIVESDKKVPDFRAPGRIVNGGKGYFTFQESGDIWIKNGADSPENFLAFEDFDQTSRFSLKKIEREGKPMSGRTCISMRHMWLTGMREIPHGRTGRAKG